MYLVPVFGSTVPTAGEKTFPYNKQKNRKVAGSINIGPFSQYVKNEIHLFPYEFMATQIFTSG
jgi:hypothetical protein